MWGRPPTRASELAIALTEVPRSARARKDRKRWCRGKVGVEHQPVIVYRPYGWSARRSKHVSPDRELDALLCSIPPPAR